eukprot:GCRY01000266.1.p1 GENE.GCRY01000266.1~~GCRY01000266.1.p1  ORF type:complete len:331 (+),score=47.24 GCRY01000266.1:188-1180(+)
MCRCSPEYTDGYHYVEWIADVFSQCVYTPREIASFVCGWVSIFIWIWCLSPQLVKNYKQKRADGLSLGFLIQWFSGDFTNLAGCLMTGQLMTQIILAAYFCIMDILTSLQVWYYRTLYPKKGKKKNATLKEVELAEANTLEKPKTGTVLNVVLPVICLGFLGFHLLSAKPSFSSGNSRNLFKEADMDDDLCDDDDSPEGLVFIIGTIFGYISAFNYVASRPSQIYKNFKRKSCVNLSKVMFCSALFGNLFYAAQIFLWSTSWDYILETLPWLVGSAGTCCFDFVILIQFAMYGESTVSTSGAVMSTGPSSDNLLELEQGGKDTKETVSNV